MKLKKITALTMAGSMAALSLTACGGGTSTTATTAAAAAETTAAAADATTAAETSNSDALFSRSHLRTLFPSRSDRVS